MVTSLLYFIVPFIVRISYINSSLQNFNKLNTVFSKSSPVATNDIMPNVGSLVGTYDTRRRRSNFLFGIFGSICYAYPFQLVSRYLEFVSFPCLHPDQYPRPCLLVIGSLAPFQFGSPRKRWKKNVNENIATKRGRETRETVATNF